MENWFLFFFFNDTATTEIYTTANTLSLHDALPISCGWSTASQATIPLAGYSGCSTRRRSEEHTSELQSLAVISYAVFCLKQNNDGWLVSNESPAEYAAKLGHVREHV